MLANHFIDDPEFYIDGTLQQASSVRRKKAGVLVVKYVDRLDPNYYDGGFVSLWEADEFGCGVLDTILDAATLRCGVMVVVKNSYEVVSSFLGRERKRTRFWIHLFHIRMSVKQQRYGFQNYGYRLTSTPIPYGVKKGFQLSQVGFVRRLMSPHDTRRQQAHLAAIVRATSRSLVWPPSRNVIQLV